MNKDMNIVLKTDKKNKGIKVNIDYYFNVIIIRTSMNERYQYYKKYLGSPDDIKYNNNNEIIEVGWIRPLSELDIKFVTKNIKK